MSKRFLRPAKRSGDTVNRKKKYVFVEDVKGQDGRTYGIHLTVFAQNIEEAKRMLHRHRHENVYQVRKGK